MKVNTIKANAYVFGNKVQPHLSKKNICIKSIPQVHDKKFLTLKQAKDIKKSLGGSNTAAFLLEKNGRNQNFFQAK